MRDPLDGTAQLCKQWLCRTTMLTRLYPLALILLTISCASQPRNQASNPVPAEATKVLDSVRPDALRALDSVRPLLLRAMDSALAALDSGTGPAYYSGPTCPMPVQRGDESRDSAMVVRYRRFSGHDTTTSRKQSPCYNPLSR